eukprot:586600-Amphidinium_carterae.1
MVLTDSKGVESALDRAEKAAGLKSLLQECMVIILIIPVESCSFDAHYPGSHGCRVLRVQFGVLLEEITHNGNPVHDIVREDFNSFVQHSV